MSTNTGVASVHGTTSGVAATVNEGQKTASPAPISQAISGRARASVPLAQVRARGASQKAARRLSNSVTSGPMT